MLFGGEDASQKRVQDRNVGFVFQHYALFKHMSVFDNIAFGLRARPRRERPSEAEIARRVNDCSNWCSCPISASAFRRSSPAASASASLLRAPSPSSRACCCSMSPSARSMPKCVDELRRWLRDLHTRTGHTTVFVTHDQDEALEVADRVVVMNKGKIEQIGAPDEVYDAPVSPFVYEFIGESSRFDVEVFSGKPYFEERPVGLPFNSLQDGPQAIYFRPQDTIVDEPKPGLINGVIRSLRRSGAARRLELAIGVHERIVEAEAPDDRHFGIGERAGLRLKRGGAFALAG